MTYTGATAAEVELGRVVPLVERLVAEGVTVSGRHLQARGGAGRARRRRGDPQRRQRACATPRSPTRCARTGAALVAHAHARGAQAGALRRPTTATSSATSSPSCASAARWPRARASPREQLDPRPGPGLRQDARARRVAVAARPRRLRGARAPAAAGRLAQVLPRRDHRAARRPSAWPATLAARRAAAADAGRARSCASTTSRAAADFLARRARSSTGARRCPAFDADDDAPEVDPPARRG